MSDEDSSSEVSSEEENEDLALSQCDAPIQSVDPPGTGPSSINIEELNIKHSSNVQIGHTVIVNSPLVLSTIVRTPSLEKSPDSPVLAIDYAPASGSESDRLVYFDELFVRRHEWNAMPARGELTPLEKSPADYVVIANTGASFYDLKPATKQAMRSIQANCFKRNLYDICFNFVIGGDGNIYEGRGWDVRGDFAKRVESRSVCVAFMGDFMFDPPPERMVKAAFALFDRGVQIGKLSPDYKLLAHKQVYNTESPGMVFIEQIMKWPHWALFEEP